MLKSNLREVASILFLQRWVGRSGREVCEVLSSKQHTAVLPSTVPIPLGFPHLVSSSALMNVSSAVLQRALLERICSWALLPRSGLLVLVLNHPFFPVGLE